MKKGFTLVEIIAVLAIFLIGGSLLFGLFNSSYKLLNRGKKLSEMEDSFRNSVLDMEKEVNDKTVTDYKIEGIGNYTINNYEEVEPLLLIDKGENSVLYFKAKKDDTNSYVFEKIIFDKNNINNNNIYIKESKTIVSDMNGMVALRRLVDDLLEVKFDFIIDNSENYRTYSTTINLGKNKSEEVVEIAGSTTSDTVIVNPPPPSDPIPPEQVNSVAKLFVGYTFIVLDQNKYNTRENLINIQPMSGTDNSGIKLEYASYYIQAISNDVMKKYINTKYTIKDNKFVNQSITKPPALIDTYKPNGLTINGNSVFKNIVTKNGETILQNKNENTSYVYKTGNECIVLVNGDLNINSLTTDNKFILGTSGTGGGQKMTVYATGRIDINISNPNCELIINNCTLISANQINIRANKITVPSEVTATVGKLEEVLKANLKLSK